MGTTTCGSSKGFSVKAIRHSVGTTTEYDNYAKDDVNNY